MLTGIKLNRVQLYSRLLRNKLTLTPYQSCTGYEYQPVTSCTVTSALRKSAECPLNGHSSQKAAQTIRILIKIIKNSVICKLFNILRCKSDDGALQRAGEISSQQNVLLQYPHPCPQDCYTQSYVVAIPKVLGSNFWYSDPVDRGVCIL